MPRRRRVLGDISFSLSCSPSSLKLSVGRGHVIFNLMLSRLRANG
jgi:uncharacterized transporter YbjL